MVRSLKTDCQLNGFKDGRSYKIYYKCNAITTTTTFRLFYVMFKQLTCKVVSMGALPVEWNKSLLSPVTRPVEQAMHSLTPARTLCVLDCNKAQRLKLSHHGDLCEASKKKPLSCWLWFSVDSSRVKIWWAFVWLPWRQVQIIKLFFKQKRNFFSVKFCLSNDWWNALVRK